MAEHLYEHNYVEPASLLAVACFQKEAYQTSEIVAYWACNNITDIDAMINIIDLTFLNQNPSAPSIFILAEAIYTFGYL
jgi:hypothetical protein